VRRLVNLPRCLIGLEAGSGSHHIARQIKPLGHDVRLIPAQYVKPFLKGHKNDYRDAEAIAEAVQRPTMNFVAIKTPQQSDLLSLHRVRSRLVRHRTAIINQIRSFLIERGITVRQGPGPLRKVLPEVLSSPPQALSPRILRLIAELDQDWRHLDERLEALSAEILSLSENDPACQRLMTVPGIGPIISSAVVASIGTGSGFKQGRDFAAWLGLVPKQESTGGRTKLGRISKRGNKYLRTLFVQAAHVVLQRRPATAMRALWPWIEQASRRLAHRNLLAIALANKLARIAWVVLARGRHYDPRITPNAATDFYNKIGTKRRLPRIYDAGPLLGVERQRSCDCREGGDPSGHGRRAVIVVQQLPRRALVRPCLLSAGGWVRHNLSVCGGGESSTSNFWVLLKL
jgi:transposase